MLSIGTVFTWNQKRWKIVQFCGLRVKLQEVNGTLTTFIERDVLAKMKVQ